MAKTVENSSFFTYCKLLFTECKSFSGYFVVFLQMNNLKILVGLVELKYSKLR